MLCQGLATLLAATAVTASTIKFPRDNGTTVPNITVLPYVNTTSVYSFGVWNTTLCNADQLEITKEWTNMLPAEKMAYIAAEQCLLTLPSKADISPGSVTRFDDLVALHQNMTPIIHAVGQFLPYHRLYMKLHKELMRSECNYTGPMAWWDETRDAGDYLNSPILYPDTGFGGNGSSVDYCLQDGPFANSTRHIGPEDTYTPAGFCLKRNVNEVNSAGADASIVESCMNMTDYVDAGINCIGFKPHTAGHGGMGAGIQGSIGDIYASPNDPLFYLHHSYIDRLWWIWQTGDVENRLYAMGGDIRMPAVGINTTLEYVLDLQTLWNNKVVGDVMDPHNSFLCMDYDY